MILVLWSYWCSNILYTYNVNTYHLFMGIESLVQGCQLTPILRFLLRFSTRLPPPPISAVLLRFPRPEENVLFTACFHCQRRIFAAERPIAKPIRALVTPAAQKGNGDWLAGHSRSINNNGGRNREPPQRQSLQSLRSNFIQKSLSQPEISSWWVLEIWSRHALIEDRR